MMTHKYVLLQQTRGLDGSCGRLAVICTRMLYNATKIGAAVSMPFCMTVSGMTVCRGTLRHIVLTVLHFCLGNSASTCAIFCNATLALRALVNPGQSLVASSCEGCLPCYALECLRLV
jgi:hypothetical protein